MDDLTHFTAKLDCRMVSQPHFFVFERDLLPTLLEHLQALPLGEIGYYHWSHRRRVFLPTASLDRLDRVDPVPA